MLQLPPISLYIHYPWCVKKCHYCDFNSHKQDLNNDNSQDYVKALLKDLDNDLVYLQKRDICSIFIGGGTPSLMSVEELNKLFIGLKKRLTLAKDIEITLETNPASFEIAKFTEFKDIGINRLSIGVQSFNAKHLTALSRLHSYENAIFACYEVQKVGFDNFNIDLMYGLPRQVISECAQDVTQAIKLNPSHISLYQLTIEPNTLFYKYPPQLPVDDDIWQMAHNSFFLLKDAGFVQYEVSAYGKKLAKHNLNYWQFGDYIGIGAGAHGKITDISSKQIFRTKKSKSPKDYMAHFYNNTNNVKLTTVSNIVFEFMLNALRLKDGFSIELFLKTTGLTIDVLRPSLTKAQALKLLKVTDNFIKPTKKGYDFLNDLQVCFL